MEYLAHNIQKIDKYVYVQNGCAVHISAAAFACVLGSAGSVPSCEDRVAVAAWKWVCHFEITPCLKMIKLNYESA